MTDQMVAEFLESFNEQRYPVEFLAKFELMECLAQNELGETLLVKDRETCEYYVAKCYLNENPHPHTSESELLKRLKHQGVPQLIGEYGNEIMFCVVRTYSSGKSLDTWVREKSLSVEQSVQIAIQLCDILHYLHSQNPPVIHRDIKPQNIIVNEKGEITLIDFGISRTYDQAASEDTLCFGTKKYAAPEQYGFSQTDCRADIFSLGILLLWMITGSVDMQSSRAAIGDKRLARIIKKCSSFAPQDSI
jgi:serine/threonine protein kinase